MESGKAIARASFPAITPEIIDLMFRDVVVKIPEPVQPVSSSSPEKLDSTEPPPNLPAAKAPKTSTVTG